VNWAAVAPNVKLDVWSKTEERKGVTTLSVLISKGYDNYINAAMDSGTIENLKSYLNNLNASLVAADLTQKIADQTKVVKQAEEKLNSLKKDADKLQSDKQKIENSIKQNLDEQQKANALINTENTKLESLKQQQKG
jgi:chromosome segregation ATPase